MGRITDIYRLGELDLRKVVQLVFVVAVAWSLKHFYSVSGPNDLRWILWPTARLTELVTGTRFYFESHAGYMSEDRSFLIAAPCSGVNFLITAFVLLCLMKLWRARQVAWRYFLFAAVAAYAVTVFANSVRIAIALWLNYERPSFLGMGREELHRLDGILVYFGFLLVLYVVAVPRSETDRLTRGRRYLFPLAVYYAATLGIPVLNGAINQGGEFWEHAVFVVVTPIVMIAAAETATMLFRLYGERERVAATAAMFPGDSAADEAGTGLDVGDAAAGAVPVRLKGGTVVLDAQL
jgi:exosortase K